MKKILFTLLLASASFAHAKEKPYFSYGDLSTMGSQPMLGFGVRTQNVHAIDLSVQIMPWNRFSPFIYHVKAAYLFYPTKTGFYCGSGLGFLNEPGSLKNPSGSLEGVIGYQSTNPDTAPTFFELNLIAPFREPVGTFRVWPGITLGYGF